MIHLIDISKSYPTRHGLKVVLPRTRLTIPSHLRVGVIGANGSGKTSLLRMISGVEEPDTGYVVRDCRTSWPLGLANSVHPEQTGYENIAFISRLYGADVEEIRFFVEDFSELGRDLESPVKTYSSGMKGKLAFGLALALDFDVYLVDEMTSVGDKNFRQKAKRAFQERATKNGLLFVSHNDKSVEDMCDVALVLSRAKIYLFDDVKEATKFYSDVVMAG